ncbi:MAG: hypothetical protein WCC60_12110 [Ilumatobacteraceae bacterium]
MSQIDPGPAAAATINKTIAKPVATTAIDIRRFAEMLTAAPTGAGSTS